MTPTILIIEDGDEYLDGCQRNVPGLRWLQAHGGAEALALLQANHVDAVLLDMRFDRTPRPLLLGDHAQATREAGGDAEGGWRHLAHHQGLYVLAALRAAGQQVPVLLAYDFSREGRRFEALQRAYASVDWLPDAVTGEGLRGRLLAVVKTS